MKPKLYISIIQCDLHWEDKINNFIEIEKSIQAVPEQTDIIVLPEMFSTGFSMNAKLLSESMDGKSVTQLKKWAFDFQKVVVGSLIIEENKHYYNRLIWAEPSGEIHYYDKKHLFTFAGENKVYNAGNSQLIIEFKGWKIACFICYDLRFPEWTRNVGAKYDAVIYVANWPETRSQAWKSLLLARAIENQSYVIGVNRIGTDANGNSYSGDSAIIDSFGICLSTGYAHKSEIISSTLDFKILTDYRTKFPVLNDIKI